MVVAAAALVSGCSLFSDFGGFSAEGSPQPTSNDAAPDGEDRTDAAPPTDTGDDASTLHPYVAAVLADAPASYYRLDEEEGPARDVVGVNPGTYVGAVSRNAPGALGETGGGAIRLTGNDDAGVLLGDVFRFSDDAAFTIELWIYVDVLDARHQQILSKVDSSTGSGWKIHAHENSGTSFLVDRPGTSSPLVSTGVGLMPVKEWVHFVVSYDQATVLLYVNGVLAKTKVTSTNIPATAVPLGIGRSSGGKLVMNGAIDEVAFYERALPERRVRAHYDAARP
jgi:hypothetical protein